MSSLEERYEAENHQSVGKSELDMCTLDQNAMKYIQNQLS